MLHEMNSYFRMQNKKILLLIDNASLHFNLHYLSILEIE